MSNNQQQQQQTHLNQLPQMIAQYQQNIEFLNNNIALLRRNIERTDISEQDREQYKKQEQELQSKLAMLQTLISNLNPQMVAQNLQQRVLSQQMNNSNQQQMNSPASTNDNMSGASAPGSPASFNPQQQQQYSQFAAGNAAHQQQQQQIRTAQQQQQQQAHQQAQQQQALNKLGLAAQAAAAQQLANGSPQGGFSSPMATGSPNVKGNVPVPTTAAAQAAVTAAAAAAGVKNNGMFTFPTNNASNVATTAPLTGSAITTPVGSTTHATAPTPAPAPKPASALSLDNDGVHRVLTKRKIQELVSQIDPSERLEPEVEEILLEIADEFIESVTTFACQLAKHRKSDTLEVKDVQLHLERNWNIRIPGFAADDIRPLRKPTIPSSHQSKVQAVNTAKSQISNTSSKKDTINHN